MRWYAWSYTGRRWQLLCVCDSYGQAWVEAIGRGDGALHTRAVTRADGDAPPEPESST